MLQFAFDVSLFALHVKAPHFASLFELAPRRG